MAKIEWINPHTDGFSGSIDLSITNKHTKATYNYSDGSSIVLTGEDLKAETGQPEHLGSGTVEKLVFKDDHGDAVLTVSGGHYDALKLDTAFENDGALGLYIALLKGNDTIDGTGLADSINGYNGDDEISTGKGADTILGGKGDDVLTGGKGSDVFAFQLSDGKGNDVITDLQISGPNKDILYIISQDIATIKSVHGGEDTQLTLENGAHILVEGVEKADFVDYWNSLVF